MRSVVVGFQGGSVYTDGMPRVHLQVYKTEDSSTIIILPGNWLPSDAVMGKEYDLSIEEYQPEPQEDES